MRRSTPLTDPTFQDVEWALIQSRLGQDSTGIKVVDIGPIDGYFTIQMAKRGAWVTAIEPNHDFILRLNTLAEFFGLSSQIDIIPGFYPAVGEDAVLNADIVFCLGLLYHLGNLEHGLDSMTKSNATLVIEGMFFHEDWGLD